MPDQDPIDAVMRAFEEFKQTNDANLKKRDDNLEAKLVKINDHLNQFEDQNKQLTLAGAQQKAMQEQLDRVEKVLNRADFGSDPAKKETREYLDAFDRVMRQAPENRSAEDMSLLRKRSASLIKGDDTSAGYLQAPPEMLTEIVKNVLELSPMRSLATVRTIGVQSLKIPRKTGSGSATRVGETAARSNTGDPAYGMLEFPAPEMMARIEVSQQMLEDSAYDLMAELREDASEQFAVKEGTEYVSGVPGALQCEGILTNADVGYTAGTDATLIKADGLIALYYALKTPYARNGTWAMNRATLAAIRKLKDQNNQYLWVPGLANGVANTILGAPYVEMADMPDIGANTYPVVFGDFKRAYVIVDRVGVGFQVDYTTGADSGLVVFRARKRTGGGVRQAEAIRKLKIATS